MRKEAKHAWQFVCCDTKHNLICVGGEDSHNTQQDPTRPTELQAMTTLSKETLIQTLAGVFLLLLALSSQEGLGTAWNNRAEQVQGCCIATFVPVRPAGAQAQHY